MREPQPLRPTPLAEVPLPHAPLVRVIAQVRFPPILAIRDPNRVGILQEALRESYPRLLEDQVHNIDLKSDPAPNVHKSIIWRLADGQQNPRWRVSLGVDFVALETSDYDSRQDFLERLHGVLSVVEDTFKPLEANRLGMRYIDRLTDDAVDRIGELVLPGILSIAHPANDAFPTLGASAVYLRTETQLLAPNGARIQGRWGMLPPSTTYDPNALEPVDKPSWVLDLDMFTTSPQPFSREGLLGTAKEFSECLYWLFRQMVTDEFLRTYGGKP